MAEGFVTKIDARDTNWGTYYDVYVDNKNLGGGKFPPKGIEVGDYVEFEVQKNNRGYDQIKPGSLRKLSKPAGVSAPAPAKPSGITLDRQDVISRQAALNSALQFVTFLASQEALPLPKSKAKQADMLESVVWEYTRNFYKQNTGATYEGFDVDPGPEEAVQWDEQE